MVYKQLGAQHTVAGVAMTGDGGVLRHVRGRMAAGTVVDVGWREIGSAWVGDDKISARDGYGVHRTLEVQEDQVQIKIMNRRHFGESSLMQAEHGGLDGDYAPHWPALILRRGCVLVLSVRYTGRRHVLCSTHRLHAYISTYTHALYVCMYVHTYIHTYIHT